MNLSHMMYFVSIFIYLTFFETTSGSAFHAAGDLKIIGGRKVSIEEAPYMALLLGTKDLRSYYASCGGSIIHERFIMTAAHCIIENGTMTDDLKLVQVGSEHMGVGGTFNMVQYCICHPKYNAKQNYINDICLLKLKDPLRFGHKIAQIKLPDKSFDLEYGTLVNITGWGAIKDASLDNITSVLELRQTTVPVIPIEDCYSVNDAALCAGSSGHNACKGDSGGPLTFNDVQIGITSIGFGNGTQTLCAVRPGVYTKVASYIDWIDTTIKENL